MRISLYRGSPSAMAICAFSGSLDARGLIHFFFCAVQRFAFFALASTNPPVNVPSLLPTLSLIDACRRVFRPSRVKIDHCLPGGPVGISPDETRTQPKTDTRSSLPHLWRCAGAEIRRTRHWPAPLDSAPGPSIGGKRYRKALFPKAWLRIYGQDEEGGERNAAPFHDPLTMHLPARHYDERTRRHATSLIFLRKLWSQEEGEKTLLSTQ